jgi:pyruvate kinase
VSVRYRDNVLNGKIEALLEQLDAICQSAGNLERQLSNEVANVHPNYVDSARNLIHYVALRNVDIRELQEALSQLGLSSLSSCEPHVMASLQAVRHALIQMSDLDVAEDTVNPVKFDEINQELEMHCDDLFGANPDGRDVEIMVTLPATAAEDIELTQELLEAGMDIARINCAHDTSREWLNMIANVKQANQVTGRSCKIVMDLAGSKVRTGPLRPGPGVLRIRPRRDGLGHVIAPRRLRLVADDPSRRTNKQTAVPVPAALIEYAAPGDVLRFRDTRGRHRQLVVTGEDEKGLIVETHKRAYLESGTNLRLHRKNSGEKLKFEVGQLPAVELPIILAVGDALLLDTKSSPGRPAKVDAEGTLLRPARVSCQPPEVIGRVPVGAPVLLNDGKIEGVVDEATADGLLIRITHAKATGSRLRAGRSINFPGTELALHGLTDTDRGNLEFIAKHADAVNLSFVRKPGDVIALQQELKDLKGHKPGIILKIETEEAFHDLPRILLAAMRSYPVGIMIARGDLAVECGWERLAEIQEEILWMCEAARIPVIWATQVLEGKAKKGRASRAEITDAAMAQRADCVMLNKGPHILSAIRMLDNILRRMQDHQYKKAPTLRKLSITDLSPPG